MKSKIRINLAAVVEACDECPPSSPYGYCPQCSAPGKLRERRMNGNDICEKGHKYPSANGMRTPNEPGIIQTQR